MKTVEALLSAIEQYRELSGKRGNPIYTLRYTRALRDSEAAALSRLTHRELDDIAREHGIDTSKIYYKASKIAILLFFTTLEEAARRIGREKIYARIYSPLRRALEKAEESIRHAR